MRAYLLAIVLVLSIVGVGAHYTTAEDPITPTPGPGPVVGHPTPDDALAAVGYVQKIDTAQKTVWLFAAVKQAEAEQAIRAPRSDGGPSGSTVGECSGFSIPDYIIRRESGGNPNAYNPSGAYGCAQTLLSHYRDGGTCGGLNPYDIQGQRDCVNRLSNGGTNLSPWAATR